MPMNNWSLILTTLALIIWSVAFSIACDDSDSEDSGKIGVVVTLLPQDEFVEKVGGDRVEVTVMIPPGANPHTYEPTPGQMTAVAQAEMYAKVGSGVEFELVWLDKLIDQNKDMQVVDCSSGIDFIEINATADNHEDVESEDNGHSHQSQDPHIWMSPRNVMIMIENICNGLVQTDPENKNRYESNRDIYINQLSQLDKEIHTGLAEIKNRVFMVYHPAFGYLAHDYDLIMLPVADEGKQPTASGLANLISQAKESNIRVIFVEPQFDPESARTIADEIGATVASIDPLAEDYISNLQKITHELVKAMQ